MTIERLHSPAEARSWCAAARAAGESIGFVPTMGALHEGHLQLVERARRENDRVVVSIFVNPLQFGSATDLERYPRDFDADATRLDQAGCDLVFTGSLVGEAGFFPEAKSVDAIPSEPPGLAALGLEGESRPGHFEGVATIVRRLFEVAQATRGYFGAKDYQQTLVVAELAERMAREGAEAPQIVICPNSREHNGLARSSRNARLSPEGKQAALVLSAALGEGRRLWREEGLRDPEHLVASMTSRVEAQDPRLPAVEIEYIALRDPGAWTRDTPETLERSAVALVAAEVEGVRLIDNLRLDGTPVHHAPPLALARDESAAVLAVAPAKVNPWLEVTSKRSDGFHEVDLTMLCIDLVDHLRVAWSETPLAAGSEVEPIALTIVGPAASADIPVDERNLIWRAARMVLRAHPGALPAGHLRVHVEKRVPSRAGLGGGSSNAAAAMIATVELLTLVGNGPGMLICPDARAAALGQLGSDCAFFLRAAETGFGRCKGRGELVESLPAGPWSTQSIDLLVPEIECPTAAVYAALHVPPIPRAYDAHRIFNRLEAAAQAAYPELEELHHRLDEDAIGSKWHLSGSGSAWFRSITTPLWFDPSGESERTQAGQRYVGRHGALGSGARVIDRRCRNAEARGAAS